MLFVTATWAQAAEPLATATAALREVEQAYAAEGVVEAVKQSTVAAQISGRHGHNSKPRWRWRARRRR